MPFRNSVVAAVISTALAGSRIVIDGTGTLANYIRFYTGAATEVAGYPATITGQQFPLSDPSYPGALYLALDSARHTDNPAKPGAALRLINSPGPNTSITAEADYATVAGFTSADLRSDYANISGNRITLQRRDIPISDPPDIRIGALSGINIAGAWVPYAATITSQGGSNPTVGNSVMNAWYMRIGKTVHVNLNFTTGTTWLTGSSTVVVSLPFAAGHGATLAGIGSMILVNSGGTFVGSCYASNSVITSLYNSFPATYTNFGALPSGAGSSLYYGITYECA